MGGFPRGVTSGNKIDILFLRKSKHLLREGIGIGETPESHIAEAVARAPTTRQHPTIPLHVANKHNSSHLVEEERGCFIELGMEMGEARFHH